MPKVLKIIGWSALIAAVLWVLLVSDEWEKPSWEEYYYDGIRARR